MKAHGRYVLMDSAAAEVNIQTALFWAELKRVCQTAEGRSQVYKTLNEVRASLGKDELKRQRSAFTKELAEKRAVKCPDCGLNISGSLLSYHRGSKECLRYQKMFK